MKGRIVLVGSRGRMGDMLLRRARAAGLDVTPLDISEDQPAAEAFGVAVPGRGTALFAPEAVAAACREAELVLLCVPAAALKETAALLRPHLPPSAVLSDIVSVKEQPMRQMCEVWPHAVVGTHPLFGPRPAEGEELPVAVTPAASAPSVFMEQGAMIMPSCRQEPLAGGAAISSAAWTTCASRASSSGCGPPSALSTACAPCETMRCNSSPGSARHCRSRCRARGMPLAPLMPRRRVLRAVMLPV